MASAFTGAARGIVGDLLAGARLLPSALRPGVLRLLVERSWAVLLAACAAAVLLAFALEPLLELVVPAREAPSGLLAIFESAPPPRHLEILAWLAPLLWIASGAVVSLALLRRVPPAVEDASALAEEHARAAEACLADGRPGLAVIELRRSLAVAPMAAHRRTLGARLEEARARLTLEPTVASADGAVAPDVGVPGPRFQILSELGAGAMGVVHLAEDRVLGRRVALKELAAARARDPSFVERFLREARALARLSHPAIVQVFDLVRADGRIQLCMELVDGGDLSARLRAGPLEVGLAVDLGRQICGALAAAHEKGVVHRDLKPENVLLTSDGRAKVSDFGIARLLDSRITSTGMILGTPSYMSPEQIRGEPVDARADLYALGALLFEMLAGEPPFRGELAAVFAQHLNAEPPPLPSHVPPELAAVVRRLLAKSPADRFGSAADVEAALAACGKAPARTLVLAGG